MQSPFKLTIWIACGAIASFAIFFALGELAARLFDVIDRVSPYPRSAFVPTGHPDLPYRLRPGFDGEVLYTAVRVNEHGLRGARIRERAAPGAERILVLGDSVVFGHMIAEEDTLSRRLEEELARRGRDDVEVLNGGVSGYNTLAERTFLESYGLALRPDAVIVGVSLNDVDDTPFLGYSGVLTNDPRQRAPSSWLARRSEFYLVLDWVVRYLRREHAFQAEAPDLEGLGDLSFEERLIAGRRIEQYAGPSASERPGWQRIRTAVSEIRDLAGSHGIELLFAIFPERFQLEQAPPNLAPQRAWLGLCRQLRLRCLNLWTVFEADGRGAALFLDVQHPNAAGMTVAARAIAHHLVAADARKP